MATHKTNDGFFRAKKRAEIEDKLAPKKQRKGPAPGSEERQDNLSDHIEAFLKSGGKVQQVPQGVSGSSDNPQSRKEFQIHSHTRRPKNPSNG